MVSRFPLRIFVAACSVLLTRAETLPRSTGTGRWKTNGILWSAKIEIPEGGAPVAIEQGDIAKNMDDKPMPAPKAVSAAAVKEAK